MPGLRAVFLSDYTKPVDQAQLFADQQQKQLIEMRRRYSYNDRLRSLHLTAKSFHKCLIVTMRQTT